KDNRNSIRKEVLHLIKFVKKTVAIPAFQTLTKSSHNTEIFVLGTDSIASFLSCGIQSYL
ncbi:hypothetical protein, partial [Enterococcus gallinarum]|uniref:hypothetical protein n=1 Tax=Enterococcus gallinarum TaxID=1353 RepID=UPI0034A32EDC